MPLGTVWSPDEDEQLVHLVRLHGPKKWAQIASDLGTKGSKQCRRRWKNFLALDERKQGSWTPEEDAQLLDGHKRHGNKWTLIAQEIGGRTDNAVKNRWAALEKKRRGSDEAPERPGLAPLPLGHHGNDLLGVRRIISKDQPRQRVLPPHAAAEMPWLQELQQQQQRMQQRPLQQQPAFSMVPPPRGLAQQTELDAPQVCQRQPDLMASFPGGMPGGGLRAIKRTSSDPQHLQGRKEPLAPAVAQQLSQDLHGLDHPHASAVAPLEEDSLLSTSRQRAQSTIAALTAPPPELLDVPGMYTSFGGPPLRPQQQLQGGGCLQTAWPGRTRSLPPQPAPAQHLQSLPMSGQLPPYQPPPGPQLPLLPVHQPGGGMQHAPYQSGQQPQFGAMLNADKQLMQQPFAPQHHAPSPPMPLQSSGPMPSGGIIPGRYERPALLQPQVPPSRYVPEVWPGFAAPPMQQQPRFAPYSYQPPVPSEPADEAQKHWGPEELKQLLEVLGEAAPGRQLATQLEEGNEGPDAANQGLAAEGLQTASSGVLGGGSGQRYQLLGTQMAPVPVRGRGPTTCL